MKLRVVEFGRIPYGEGDALQACVTEIPSLLVGEHDAVYTRGHRGRHVPNLPAPIIDGWRGGDLTYHGPGQLVCRPVIAARRARDFTQTVEQVVIAALADEGVEGTTRDRYPGVWVDGRKIASLGFILRGGHIIGGGFGVNVTIDLRPFTLIQPCGIAGVEMTSLAVETGRDEFPEFTDRVIAHFAEAFDLEV